MKTYDLKDTPTPKLLEDLETNNAYVWQVMRSGGCHVFMPGTSRVERHSKAIRAELDKRGVTKRDRLHGV